MDWLTETTLRVAAAAGIDPGALLVDATAAEQLLDLAGFAAHDSGERTNAPLLCYLIGLAAARSDADVDTLAAAVTRD